MKHPSDLLDRYSSGLLAPPSLIAIDEHLESCDECRNGLVPPPGVDLDRVWTALAVALDLSDVGIVDGSTADTRSPEAQHAGEITATIRPERRLQSLRWLQRPVWVAIAAAVAVLLIVGGGALIIRLLGPDAPPVITTPTTTPTPSTTLPVAPPESSSLVIPADVVGRGTAIIASIDTAGDTGTYPALAMGVDGLPVVAYLDRSDGVINVMKCTTADCSGNNVLTALGAADMETAPAIALTPAGLPVIAYAGAMEGAFPDAVMLARCSSADCSSFSSNPLPIEVSDQGLASISVVIGSADVPVISFIDGDLKTVVCQDAACTEATLITFDSMMGWSDRTTSAAVGSDGNPAIAYLNGPALKLAACRDARCAESPVITTLVENLAESTVSLAFSPTGLPVIAYIPAPAEMVGSSTVGVISCADEACRQFAVHEVSVGAAAGVSIAVAPDGLPVFVYSFRDIGIVTCRDRQCAEPATISRIDTEAGYSGASIAMGSDGLPRVAYGAGSDLKVATCSTTPCLAEDPPLPPPDARGVITTTVSQADAELIGANPSLVIDAEGRPAVMYTSGQETPRPKLVRCLDAACSISTDTLVDVPGFHNTLTFGPSGLPVIAHHDWERVLLTRCEDANCSTTSTVELERSEFAYFEPVAVAWLEQGAPVIAFQNGNDYYIHVVACEDASCSSSSSGRVESFADPDNTRWYANSVDIVVPSDGLPVVAVGQSSGQVRVAKCSDQACTASTATIIEDGGLDTLTSRMILGTDDLPIIAYYADGELRTAKCQNAACTDYTVTTIGTGVADFIASVAPSIALGDNGLSVIGFWAPGRVLQLAACHDQACSTSTVSTFGNANTFALAIGADGLPVIAYHDAPELVVAKCGDASCGAG